MDDLKKCRISKTGIIYLIVLILLGNTCILIDSGFDKDCALRRVKSGYQGLITTPPGTTLTSEQFAKAQVLFGESFAHVKQLAEELRASGETRKITVLHPIYRKGAIRIQSKGEVLAEQQEIAENSLREKIEQLNDLLAPYKDVIQWELVIADHSPDLRGQEPIERIAAEQVGLGNITEGQVRFLGLSDIEGKGETIIEAFKLLIGEENPSDVLIYTDDDLSVDLRQTGNLLKAILEDGYGVAVGSRAVSGAVALPGETDEEKAISRPVTLLKKQFLLLPLMEHVRDTQCGFKAYSREALEKTLNANQDGSFTFDTEMMLHALNNGYDIKETPILWYDAPNSSVNTKTRWRMALTWIEQYERLVKPQLVGTNAVILNDDQIQFLKGYINDAIQEITDGADIPAQIETCDKLYAVLDNWLRVHSDESLYLPEVESRINDFVQANLNSVEEISIIFKSGSLSEGISKKITFSVPRIDNLTDSDSVSVAEIKKYVEAMIVSGIVIYGSAEVAISSNAEGSSLTADIIDSFENTPYLAALSDYIEEIYGDRYSVYLGDGAVDSNSNVHDEVLDITEGKRIMGYTLGYDQGGSDSKFSIKNNFAGGSETVYEREFNVSMGNVDGSRYMDVIFTNIDFGRLYVTLESLSSDDITVSALREKVEFLKNLHQNKKEVVGFRDKIDELFGEGIVDRLIATNESGQEQIDPFVELELMQAMLEETAGLNITSIDIQAAGVSWGAAVANGRVAARRGKLDQALTVEEFEQYVVGLGSLLEERYDLVEDPLVVNDGDAAALLAMLKHSGIRNVLALPMGTSLGGGYLDASGKISGFLLEISKAMLNIDENAPLHADLKIPGVMQQILGQDGVYNFALNEGVTGVDHSPDARRANLKSLIERLDQDPQVEQVFKDVGQALGHTIALFKKFVPVDHGYLIGAVTSGRAGEIVINAATAVLEDMGLTVGDDFWIIGSEEERRLGQAGAMADYVAYMGN
jgi:hypothetical protein